MTEKTSLEDGWVEIKLANSDGELEEIILKPSFRAAKMISRLQGGYMGAAQQIGLLDFDAICKTLSLAMGLAERGERELPERVYATGPVQLSGPLIRFIHILANGGKPPRHDEDDKKDPLEKP